MDQPVLDLPRAWERAAASAPAGVLMVVGAPDAGKSTFARYLYGQLAAAGRRIAYLDGDPGQTSLGPPTTITVAFGAGHEPAFPPAGPHWRRFVGATSPRGHMLELLVGAAQLAARAFHSHAQAVIYDTNGLVDPGAGGDYLKLAEIDLLRPAAVYAIQREHEMERLLIPLRLSRRTRLIDLPASSAAHRREVPARQAYRAVQFGRYFHQAQPLALDWRKLAIFPAPRFSPNRLLALEDAQGFARGLAIVTRAGPEPGHLTLLTPLATLERIDALRLGDLLVEPGSWRDEPLSG